MPTFTRVTVATDFVESNAPMGLEWGCGWTRLEGGRIYICYATSDGRYIKARYSDDNGATWSSAETVHDQGSGGSNFRPCTIAQNFAGRLCVLVGFTAADQSKVYERSTPTSTGSWTLVVTHASNGAVISNTVNQKLLGDPLSDLFYIVRGNTGGNSGAMTLVVNKLTPGAPWTEAGLSGSPFSQSNYSDGGGQFGWGLSRRWDAVIDEAGTIHYAGSHGRSNVSDNYTIFYGTITTPSGTPSHNSEEAFNNSGNSNPYAMSHFQVVLDGNNRPWIYFSSPGGTGTVNDAYYIEKSNGSSWTSPATLPSGTATNDGDYILAANKEGGTPKGMFASKSWDGNTSFYNVNYASTNNTRVAFTNQNSVDRIPAVCMGYDAARKWTQFDAGWVWSEYEGTSANTLRWNYSTDLDWDEATAVHNKTIEQTLHFTDDLSPQGWIVREVSGETVTPVTGGGRQIIKEGDGTSWHCYYADGGVKVAYSTDGLTWTEVAVGPTWVPAGMCMAQGSSNNPVLILTRPSNDDFYIYQWNGSSFILKKQLNEPTNASESFQVLYTGSTYLLIYGFVTGSGDRHVKSRTSTDLITWSAATTVKNGDGGGTGSHRYRRVAACLDSDNDIHAVYSIRVSGDHTLFYRKWSGGSWGTEQTIVVGGTGGNISDFQSGLSIAVDDQDTVHVAARVQSPTYTSRVRIRYFRGPGTWTAESVHDEADGDQGFPSISLNGRRPAICFMSQDLGEFVVRYLRNTDGSAWVAETIKAATRDNVQTVHGPAYGSTYNYSRGQAGSMSGSEEYFYSSDLLSGTAAFCENTVNFESILSTLQRVMTNTVTFSGSLDGVHSLGFVQTIHFTQQLNFTRDVALSSVLEFRQNLFGTTATPLYQTILFTDSLGGIKSPIKEFTDTITFEQSLTLTKSGVMENTAEFSGFVTANIIKRQGFEQNIDFGSVLTLNFSLIKVLSSILTFLQGLAGFKADEGCDPDFTPEKPIPDSEDDVQFVYLIGPVPELTLSVQLKRPEYGNGQRQSLQVGINRTRGGTLRVHKRQPTYRTLTATFADLTLLKMDQVGNFLRTTKARKVYYLDELGRTWEGYIVESDIDLVVEARDKGGTFVMDFEGRLV